MRFYRPQTPPTLTPSELLRTPTLFSAWLERQGDRRFKPAHSPYTCPLATFLAEAGYQHVHVLGSAITWGGNCPHCPHGYCKAPRWARRFQIRWDIWGMLVPGWKTARRARWTLHTITKSQRYQFAADLAKEAQAKPKGAEARV